jgi:hypothetical protein
MEKICKNCGKFYANPQEKCKYHYDKKMLIKRKVPFSKMGGDDAFKQVWSCCKNKVFKAINEGRRSSNQDLERDQKGCLVSNSPICPKNKKSNDLHVEWTKWTNTPLSNPPPQDIPNLPPPSDLPSPRPPVLHSSQDIINKNVPLKSKKALIIANTYQNHDKLSKLPNCHRDAMEMKAILEKKSFQVIEKLDANRTLMIKTIKEFGETIEPGDWVVFYFSGHGLSFDGFHCLLPNDYEGDESSIVDFSITFVSLMKYITKNKPHLKVFLFDCCRTRPFEHINTDKGTQYASFNTIVSTELGQNILIASATAESATASGNGRNGMSLWTSYLSQELNNNIYNDLDIEKCLKTVRWRMNKENHSQIPWQSSSLLTDFYI